MKCICGKSKDYYQIVCNDCHVNKIAEAFTKEFHAKQIKAESQADGFVYEPTKEMIDKAWDNVAKSYENPLLKMIPQESPTGSLRFNSGKPQSNEISPSFILAMGEVLEKARLKYPRGNWEKGNDYSVPYDSMMRHLLAWQSGEKLDKESQLSHLAHAALNLMMLHYYEENYPQFDDRIFKKDKK